MTNFVFEHTDIALTRRSLPQFLIWSFVIIITTSLAVRLMLNYLSRENNGSGVPQLKPVIVSDLSEAALRTIF